MIRLIPVEEITALKELCARYGLEYSEDKHAYISASEGVKAQCVFSLKDYRVELLAASFDESDPLLPEMLILAVGAYAANRSGYLFYIKKEVGQAMAATLKTLRFEENETEYFGKVPKILEGSCRCKDK